MLLLSSSFASLIEIFAPLFDSRVWSYAQLLLVGAVLAPGKRTVTNGHLRPSHRGLGK